MVNLGFEDFGDNVFVVLNILKDFVLIVRCILRGVDHNEDCEYDEADHRNQVAPYVCGFVVEHEQTLEVKGEIMEIDPVAESDVFVVDQPRMTCPGFFFGTDEWVLVYVDI